MQKRRVGYVCDELLVRYTDSLIPFSLENEFEEGTVYGRGFLVHSLISAYGLTGQMIKLPVQPLEVAGLLDFHGDQYLKCLEKTESRPLTEGILQESENFGLGYDCPLSAKLLSKIKVIAGATVSCAKALNENVCDIAINWNGGWHHAKRNEASGFCYVNDIVLGIKELRKKFARILYIDLDVHHGDGVESAFYSRNDVFTFSIHQFEPGYFPGTGSTEHIGVGKGKYYSLNIPLKEGAGDKTFLSMFTSLFSPILKGFKPEAVVCQCGGDVLVGDPLGGFNITPTALCSCTEIILSCGLPLMFLGGGGYNLLNTAKCWTLITGTLLGIVLQPEIPEFECYDLFCSSSSLQVNASNRRDHNDQEYVDSILVHGCELIRKMKVYYHTDHIIKSSLRT